jgi:hypothetical protein
VKIAYDIDGIIEEHEIEENLPLVSPDERNSLGSEDVVFTEQGAFRMVVASFVAGFGFGIVLTIVLYSMG